MPPHLFRKKESAKSRHVNEHQVEAQGQAKQCQRAHQKVSRASACRPPEANLGVRVTQEHSIEVVACVRGTSVSRRAGS